MTIKRTVLGNGTLIIDVGEVGAMPFQEQVTNLKLIPKVKTGDPVKVLSGSTAGGEREESWELKGKILPDFGETGSIQEWCFTNRGKDLDFEFVPRTDLTKKLTGTLTVEAVEIGGDVGKADPIDFTFVVLTVALATHTPA